ncbi:GNAT family N-acetyltransferase [Planctomicrobium sp. SH664]|uniref:GNAT family N-acetyltransferase n=1 Tax=Planctomicrobium sp. SH664 TaxID=3448125 RepID=UPI003F5C08E7
MSVMLESMTAADAPAVIQFWSKQPGMGLGPSDTPEGIAAYLQRNPELSWVARCGDRVVGAVLCGHDGRRGSLHHLAVDREFQRQGIARSLVEACLSGLHRQGLTKCNIFVYAANVEGCQFWSHLGWTTRHDLLTLQQNTAPAS